MSVPLGPKGLVLALAVILLILLVWFWLCPEPDAPVSVGWSSVPDDATHFARFLPLAAGGALASTREGDVYAIDSGGRETLLLAASEPPAPTRVVFNGTGDTFGILHEDGFSVYDAQGGKLSDLPLQPGFYKLVPSGRRIYSPEVREDGPEDRTVINARILDGLGVVQASWPVPGLEISRLTSQHLVYATATELIKTTLAGTELWRTPVRVRKLAVSDDATRSIVNSARDSNTIHQFAEETMIGTDRFERAVWNLAISPDGRHSAATSQTELRMYQDGVLKHAIELPVEFAVSVDVNDRGGVLVGGQAARHVAYVALYDAGGALIWEDRSAPDDNAWRPEVRFDASGDHCVVRHKDKLTSYTIDWSP